MLRLTARLRNDQRGFTLVETLVAMVTGVVVVGALFAILDFSVKQTARLSEVSQVAQTSGTAMTHIVDELHSACLSPGYAPVRSGSSPTKLVLVNAYFPETNEKGEAEYKFVRKDEIEFASGKLTDTLSRPTGEEKEGEFPWKVSGTTTLAEGISQTPTASSTEPVFRYYKYANKFSSGSSTTGASTLEELKATPSAKEASETASVVVSFRTSPVKKEAALSKSSETGVPVDLKTQTTFALGAPNSEATISAGPCE